MLGGPARAEPTTLPSPQLKSNFPRKKEVGAGWVSVRVLDCVSPGRGDRLRARAWCFPSPPRGAARGWARSCMLCSLIPIAIRQQPQLRLLPLLTAHQLPNSP